MKISGKTIKRITAMIPAKLGSTRLRMKNLALIGGKPLVYYPIKAAKDSGVFTRIVINAEDPVFLEIAKRYKVDFYKRPENLVRPNTKTDEVIYDFLKKNPCDIVAWVSPIAPLQTGAEVRGIVRYFLDNDLDSLMTVKDEQVHCVYNEKPVNFRSNEIFAQTQDLAPVRFFVYSVMMWRSDIFIREFERKGHALLCGRIGFYTVSKASSIIIKRPEDLAFAESLKKVMRCKGGHKVKYDKLAGPISKEVT